MTDKQHLPWQLEGLRDEFAKAALQSLIAHFDYGRIGFTEERMDAIAKEAYGMADAMLKARGWYGV
nr:hypothetical protein [Providencia rettgeri]